MQSTNSQPGVEYGIWTHDDSLEGYSVTATLIPHKRVTVLACHRQAAEFYYLGFVESATTDFITDSYCQRFTDSEVKAFCGLTNHWRISESQCVVYLFFLTWSIAQTPNYSKRSHFYIAGCAMFQFNFTSFGSRRGRTSAQKERLYPPFLYGGYNLI